MKYIALINATTKLPEGWTYTTNAAKKGDIEILSDKTYTLTKTQKNRIPFYRIAIPIERHNILGELKTTYDHVTLTINEAKMLFPGLSNEPLFNTIVQNDFQLNQAYDKQQQRLTSFCEALEKKYNVQADIDETLNATLFIQKNGKTLTLCLANFITNKQFYAYLESWLNK